MKLESDVNFYFLSFLLSNENYTAVLYVIMIIILTDDIDIFLGVGGGGGWERSKETF